MLGWAGMRGVVSLAAALSIPLLTADGQAFPFRNLILFITFIVILVTLVFQGLTLPWVIRKVGPKEGVNAIPAEEQERNIQQKIAEASIAYLEEKHAEDVRANGFLKSVHGKFKFESDLLSTAAPKEKNPDQLTNDNHREAYLALLDHQRKVLADLNQDDLYDEDLIRKYLALVDLEEFKVREKNLGEEVDKS